MIDHITIHVRDVEASRRFYETALAPIDYRALYRFSAETAGIDDVIGFGVAPKAEFWIVGAEPGTAPSSRLHIALRAEKRGQVDAFHRAALKAGGRDNGAPGLRPQYHPTYYGAFVFDLDGHNLEVVCHSGSD